MAGRPCQDHTRALGPPAPQGPWRAGEVLVNQILEDLATDDGVQAPRGRAALTSAARVLRAVLGALGAAHDQLTAQERLATLGRLAAAVAHELRRPLFVLSGGLELLERELAQHPPDEVVWLRRHLGRLQDAAAQAARLTASFSTASKPPRPEFHPVAVARLLDDTHTLISCQALLQRVTVTVDQQPDLSVQGDRSQLLEVLLNLATNALEAMADGGTLDIRAQAEPGAVILELADTGPGIPPEIQARIFEPFFTTKTEGTGLGLAIVRQLVQAHGGTLTLESQPGRGTTFRLRLPTAGERCAATP